MLELLQQELEDIQDSAASKQDVDDLRETLQLAIRHDVWECNDRKRGRYIKIIGNTLRGDVQVTDLASFIQDAEQLGERDFLALQVMNQVMNKEGDWNTNNNQAIHPNTFIQRRQELVAEIAKAFGQDTSKSIFSREEGFEACARLQGFGLAHEYELSPRQIPIGDYCFRPSKRGLLLLKLVGEDV